MFAAVFFHLPLAVGSLDEAVVLKGNMASPKISGWWTGFTPARLHGLTRPTSPRAELIPAMLSVTPMTPTIRLTFYRILP